MITQLIHEVTNNLYILWYTCVFVGTGDKKKNIRLVLSVSLTNYK